MSSKLYTRFFVKENRRGVECKLPAARIAGVSAELGIDPSGRYVRIVLCKASPPMAMSMGASIGEWLKQLPR